MATTLDFIRYATEQLASFEHVRYQKMFGEYMIYVHEKPVLLVCDNSVFVKKIPEVAELMKNADCGLPYPGAKEHYVLDIDDTDWVRQVVTALVKALPSKAPKKK
jgi:TfoX/Sxy family transcriptional regulator of competence genes